ncbi:MAG: hypothetical protein Q9183_005436 [Haloplaca sp. 2 TL-2023]
MRSFTTVLAFTGLVPLAFATYSIKDNYSPDKFLDMFEFETSDDLTHGYVDYVNRETAQEHGLLGSKDDKNVVFRVDDTSVASGRGRKSVRLASKAKYNKGLVVIDIAHMPGNACGVWPAFWMTGPNWPNSGEIDILEGVNLQSENMVTMHTSESCSFAGSSCFAPKGCSANGGAFGDGFNKGNGGIYAMEWTSNAIHVWHFPRGKEPEGILGKHPDPRKWGEPTTRHDGGDNCHIDSHFKDQQIVFTTTFCGDWAGTTFSSDSTCAQKAPTCPDFVQNNPKAFSEAFWEINALKVYTQTNDEPSFESDGEQPDDTNNGPKPDVTVAPGSVVTEYITAPPVTITLQPGQAMPQEPLRQDDGLNGKRRRARRQHLEERI